MDRRTESGRAPRRLIDAEAKACFLGALRAGAARDEAARLAGFSAQAFYDACGRDPVFALARAFALELSAAEGRAARAAPGDVVIAPNRNRLLQKRHVRRTRFDDRRKRIFLDHFAVDADAHAACAAAGIACSTYTQHRRKDPEFAAGCDEALLVAYAGLEAEVLRERLEAQRNLRDGIVPAGEAPKHFERNMRVLDRYQRRGGGIGIREVGHGALKRGEFMEGIAWLDESLRGLGIRWDLPAEPIALPRSGSDEAAPEGDSHA